MSNPQHDALKKYTWQINYALQHYTPHALVASNFNHVLICGMGGSGIGGQIARSIFASEFPLAITTLASYDLPAYANDKTLVILGSYSGNTEETLAAFDKAIQKGCTVITLSSGGKLSSLAKEMNIPCYKIESGFQPRMALGFSLTYLILILGELMGKDNKPAFLEIIKDIDEDEEDELYKYAEQIYNQVKTVTKSKFVIITDPDYEALGIRFAQQIQENAKHECFVHVLPEMNHNVIESYYGRLDSVFFFIHSHQHERIDARFEFLSNLLEVENHKVVHFTTESFGIKQVYELNYTLDWLSLMVADHRRVDSLNVPNITSLKDFLDEVSTAQ
jgi:glucose/mannose-6-phosphate isomerase